MNITKSYLTPNAYSRPQSKISKVRGVVIHWVANKNTTATANRNFFENRKYGKTNYGSAHYIVNLDGAIVQCLPDTEVGYHVGSNVYTQQALNKLSSYPNNCTLGIECTHTDDKGKMTDATYNATLELAVKLLKDNGLTENDLWLHHTVVGWKDCHRYFVNNNSEWTKFKRLAGEKLNGKANLNPEVDTGDIVYPTPDSTGSYTVRKGDTLWGISQQLGISLSAIEKLNPNVKAKALQIGQKVKVKDVAVKPPTPSKPATSAPQSIVDWMNANKMDSSYTNRAKLAKEYDIKGYEGSEGQNIQLLAKLKAGKPVPKPAPNKPTAKGDQKTKSIVVYLDSIGADSSYDNRVKLAAANDVKGYKGTASQNLLLLAKLRGGKTPVTTKPKPVDFKVGSKVKIKSNAKKYAGTNTNIPSQYKGKSYTIQQVKGNQVLLKELYSWVKKTDLQ
ncbi:N-acetylmuramoyl-L-alanine amidase [Lederbergia lenta]|uniref:N-acetylmuramoyl-L-alanine amidase n=1 Tax=Lederbergia lenta TaxID=1467 RepID=UPI00203E4FB1|nr:N-acetylmuramoyl-L-alanine amidase [Lederbergia lenta]MCM3110057.1 N-acetylmuramoyl-L-alanine amidase [Lederbergia lenta]